MVGASLEQVTGYVNKAAARGGFDRADAHLSRRAVTLDEQGWRDLAGELEVLMAKLEQIEGESAERLREAGDEHGDRALPSGVVLMLFEAAGVPEDGTTGAADGDGKHLGRRSSRRPRPLHAAATVELD
jgi:hypothetical protein